MKESDVACQLHFPRRLQTSRLSHGAFNDLLLLVLQSLQCILLILVSEQMAPKEKIPLWLSAQHAHIASRHNMVVLAFMRHEAAS